MFRALLLCALVWSTSAAGPTYSATYLPSNVPEHTEEGQAGTNRCGTGSNQTSMCQNAYMNSLSDWCLWAPPAPGPQSTIGDTERIEVAWCIQNGTGARLIPDGAITGAHWLITPDYVQVTGIGNMTLLNIPARDAGGELDPHGADGNGNPVGGLVFSTAFGQLEQVFEWTNFMGDDQFCFRICDPKGSNAPGFCQHIYDELGCQWNMPANYGAGFDTCHADSGEPMGVYGGSTFHQGEPATPPAHPAPSPKSCTTVSTIGNGLLIQGTSIVTSAQATSGAASGSGVHTTSGSGRPTAGSGSRGVPSPTGSSNSAGSFAAASIQGWERLIVSVGLAIAFSLLGAGIVL
ncbi:hypothetical protein B0H15DRAFT_306905 [Mycena belliarum]|uniref:Macrofage activating glycoprotein n=1 Tax=Mycena belliarum TaxID=1033014 RepID=A0AAD6XQH9_9AGAR|nr:hypothetical protein B0H15DRAFT_306905 [Mycena belliae]